MNMQSGSGSDEKSTASKALLHISIVFRIIEKKEYCGTYRFPSNTRMNYKIKNHSDCENLK